MIWVKTDNTAILFWIIFIGIVTGYIMADQISHTVLEKL